MKNALIFLAVLGIFTFPFNAAQAHADHSLARIVAKKNPAEVSFDRIKALVGRWEGTGFGQKVEVTYELASGGHSVVEKFAGMVSVYHVAGELLMMTHYCSSGNNPRMVAAPPKDHLDPIQFTFHDITNLKPGSGHISGLTLIWTDADTLIARWSSRDGATGKDTSFDFNLKRAK